MKYTSSHWGSYRFSEDGDRLLPIHHDPDPSRIGRGWVSASRNRQCRILRPALRQGWLQGDGGKNRCRDSYVEVSWETAIEHAAHALKEVRTHHGNGAIFGGSYGWASAGRFHHAQSQLRRFLNLAGGFVSARNTYSHAATEVLFPRIVGLSNRAFQDQMTAMPLVAEHCQLLLAVGGISTRTAQVTSSGTTTHEVGPWLETMHAKGTRIINVSPRKSDLPQAEWLAIRPGTDTALLLALAHEVTAAGRADLAFMDKYTSGWEHFRAYLLGETDGVPKTADWAAALCDIEANTIRTLAEALTHSKSMIATTWGMQRAEYGEQPVWAALALAAILGQIGQPGTGFSFGYGSTTPVGRAAKLIPWPSVPQGINPIDDYIPVARVTDMLLKPGETYRYDGEQRHYPDIKLIWWAGGNPFHHQQDLFRLENAWKTPQTVIVNDHSWTATARRADIVLPSTTPLERSDIMMNRRDPTLLWMSQLDTPLGEALDDFEIFSRLADRMGFVSGFTEDRNADEWLRHLWQESQRIATAHGFELPDFDSFKRIGRFDVPDAAERRIALADFIADPEQNPLHTESGRITLTNDAIGEMELDSCPAHPAWLEPCENLLNAASDEFHLLSGQPDTRLHAQNDMGSESLADKVSGREAVYIHPSAAAKYGFVEGGIIELHNNRGACLAGVRFDEGLRPDCVFLPTGAWFDPQEVDGRHIDVHGNPNALTIDKGCSELSQGNIAHTCLIRLRKWNGDVPGLTVTAPPEFVSLT